MTLDPAKLMARLHDLVWRVRLPTLPPWQARLMSAMRLAFALYRDLVEGQVTLRAMGLVYTTLLSLVPLLALSFSALKAFGVHNQLRPFLLRLLGPLGPNSEELTTRIIGFIDRVNGGVLGSVGLALLLYTSVSLVHKVEESFNFVWHVPRSRTIGRRFGNYLSILLVGPVLVFAAISLTVAIGNLDAVQSLLAIAPLGRLARVLGRLLPYVLVVCAFALVYLYVPNTRVRAGPALAGGIVGGVLWQSAGWAFTTFVASSGRYAAIYSGFAVVILFLIWLYVSWLILLLGASVAFYGQNPGYLVAKAGEPNLSNRMRERLALLIMSRVASRYLKDGPPWSREQLTDSLGMPLHVVDTVLDALCRRGFLAETSDSPSGYLPARDLAQATVADLLEAIRAAGEDQFVNPGLLPVSAEVGAVLERLERASRDAAGTISLAELAAVK